MKAVHNLDWHNLDPGGPELPHGEITRAMGEIAGGTGAEWARTLEGGLEHWEQPEADMQALSERFPGVRFVLTCQDQDGETWRISALRGRTKTADGEMTFGPPSGEQPD